MISDIANFTNNHIAEADLTHLWMPGMELPYCALCGMSKIGARIWGDAIWTRTPKPCPRYWLDGSPAHIKEEADDYLRKVGMGRGKIGALDMASGTYIDEQGIEHATHLAHAIWR